MFLLLLVSACLPSLCPNLPRTQATANNVTDNNMHYGPTLTRAKTAVVGIVRATAARKQQLQPPGEERTAKQIQRKILQQSSFHFIRLFTNTKVCCLYIHAMAMARPHLSDSGYVCCAHLPFCNPSRPVLQG